MGGIESEGVAVSEPGKRDITASHGVEDISVPITARPRRHGLLPPMTTDEFARVPGDHGSSFAAPELAAEIKAFLSKPDRG